MNELDKRQPVMKFKWYDLGNGVIVSADVDWAYREGFYCFPANFFVAQNAVYLGMSLSEMPYETFDETWKVEKAKAKAIVKALNKAKIRVPLEDQEETIIEAQLVIALENL